MWRALTALRSKPDRAFVAWVTMALVLAFAISPWRLIAPAAAVQGRSLSAAPQPEPQDEEGELPSSSSEEPTGNPLNFYEEDELDHDKGVLFLTGLNLKPLLVVQLEPDSLHARKLDRPPLRLA